MNSATLTNGTKTITFEFSGGNFGRCVIRKDGTIRIVGRGQGLSKLGRLVAKGWVRAR